MLWKDIFTLSDFFGRDMYWKTMIMCNWYVLKNNLQKMLELILKCKQCGLRCTPECESLGYRVSLCILHILPKYVTC